MTSKSSEFCFACWFFLSWSSLVGGKWTDSRFCRIPSPGECTIFLSGSGVYIQPGDYKGRAVRARRSSSSHASSKGERALEQTCRAFMISHSVPLHIQTYIVPQRVGWGSVCARVRTHARTHTLSHGLIHLPGLCKVTLALFIGCLVLWATEHGVLFVPVFRLDQCRRNTKGVIQSWTRTILPNLWAKPFILPWGRKKKKPLNEASWNNKIGLSGLINLLHEWLIRKIGKFTSE